jgi:uncharacterized protein (TIGR03435 family)
LIFLNWLRVVGVVWFSLLVSGSIPLLQGDQIDRFDTISIHESAPGDTGSSIRPNPNNFRVEGCDLEFLIQLAYGLNPSDVTNIPSEFRHKRFDIIAKEDVDPQDALKLAPRSEEAQVLLQARLRTMLSERFQLRFHKTLMNQPVLDLAVEKHGPKLTAATVKAGSQTQAWGYLKFEAVDMEGLASALSSELQTKVRDKTDLTESYAFELRWDTHDRADSAEYPFSTLNDALNEQLGLRLIPTRASVPVLVVDSVTMPTPN